MRIKTKVMISAALGLLALAAPASAQFLTFVSAAGNDANTCFVQANPCKTLQRGINQTNAGGELRLLSSLVSNGFINKSITVEGGRYTVVGTIAVNNASAIVRFRRINLNGVHAFPTGFNLINAAAVHIEDCSAERYTGNGISLSNSVSTELTVSKSVSRDNGQVGLEVSGPSTAVLAVEDSSFENNGDRGILFEAGEGSISRSTFFGNDSDLRVIGGTVTAVGMTAAGSSDIGFSLGGGQMTLVACDGVGHTSVGLFLGSGTARVSDCVFTGNGTGILNGGTALTLGNNLVAGNTTNLTGALMPLAPE